MESGFASVGRSLAAENGVSKTSAFYESRLQNLATLAALCDRSL
jgi:hypothetical protein